MRLLAGLVIALLANLALAGARPPDPERSKIDLAVMKIDEQAHLGQALAPQTALVDAQGRAFQLGQTLGKPVILVLSYFGCDGSCPTIARNLATALQPIQRFKAGRDFEVLMVSFDRQDSVATADAFFQQLRKQVPGVGEGWHVSTLAGATPESVKAFASQVGFNFFWSRADKTFLHPNVLIFLTPEGRVARYIYGTAMDSRTIELALIDADWGRISESREAIFDMITGACYSFNYSDGRYQPNYALLTGVGALLFGLSAMAIGFLGYRRKLARRLVHAH